MNKFALKMTCKEARAFDDTLMTKEGDVVWVVRDYYGWTCVTSINRRNDVVTFDTREEAEKAAKDFKGHPWYCKPKSIEVVEVKPLYERITGWEEV